MEPNDFKTLWQKQSEKLIQDKLFTLNQIDDLLLQKLKKAHLSLFTKFGLDAGIILIIYTGVGLLIYLKGTPIDWFFIKLLIIPLISVLPIFYRYGVAIYRYKKQNFDLGVNQHLKQSLNYYRQTKKLFQILYYITIGLFAIVFLLDDFFYTLSPFIQAGIFLYLIIMSVLTKPLAKWVFDKDIATINQMLKELEK